MEMAPLFFLLLVAFGTAEITLPDLPGYGYSDLEPFMDEATVRVHHDGHFAAYTNKLNDALEEINTLSPGTLPEDPVDMARNYNILVNRLRKKVTQPLVIKFRNNLGGYLAHDLFFRGLTPAKAKPTEYSGLQTLGTALKKSWGSLEDFKEKFLDESSKFFGSGWVWLVLELKSGELMIMQTKDQDTPYSAGLEPIMCIDMWEHAFYLKHKNDKQGWGQDFWRLVNWEQAELRYLAAQEKRAEKYPVAGDGDL
eukprot:TRINITY_DN26039_c0_g1_i1.p1 TRINITY_DN26039_c0_g1~~TRINITY_DN26039_c0_g1_i1.p1  ORF type:complete len:261 (+),score=19.28 TRINITY_DN26039_c0_g1_i1:27-785(+)